jgi:hypothetical protein
LARDSGIEHDFQKLLLGRAKHRVLIFYSGNVEDRFNQLAEHVRRFARTQAGDRYLLLGLDRHTSSLIDLSSRRAPKKLAGLTICIAANNAVIERINRKGLPDGAKWLPGAELVARGMQGFSAGGPPAAEHRRAVAAAGIRAFGAEAVRVATASTIKR